MSQLSSLFVLHLVAVFLIGVPRSFSIDLYSSCSNLFSCGEIKDVGFPFWGGQRRSGCGYPQLELTCEDNSSTIIVIESVKYLVRGFDPQGRVLRIARQDYSNGICLTEFRNTTLDYELFDWAPGYANFTFVYGCIPVFSNFFGPGKFNCSDAGLESYGYILPEAAGTPPGCSESVIVPVSDAIISTDGWWTNLSSMTAALQEGFNVKLQVDSGDCSQCIQSKGVCGYDLAANQTTCYCLDQSLDGSTACTSAPSSGAPQEQSSPPAKKKTVSFGVGMAIAAIAIVGMLFGFWLLGLFQSKRSKRTAFQTKTKGFTATLSSKNLLASSSSLSKSTPSNPSSKSEIENGNTYLGVPVFSYTELEEATCNFDTSREIGDGGFGIVYYGKLRDGRVVAIKRLYENNLKRAEQFMNEVEILTRLQHQNLVKLYGCTSRRSRELLMVYEYIPNGTVADHLFGTRASFAVLPWRVRLNIAIETADALAYLHRSDVIHRDVKTNNILLDNNFHVRVADFGLSKLFPTDVTHVSTAPQGSPGYVDPEYYQTYRLTDKSDVYSFGVVLCELISSKPAVDTNRHRHDINLANMAVSRIQRHALHEFVDPRLGFETDNVVKRTVEQVAEQAFRCLQDERDMRPTMDEILEALKRIEIEQASARQAEILDIHSNDVRLLNNDPTSRSPDSTESLKWDSSSTTTSSV